MPKVIKKGTAQPPESDGDLKLLAQDINDKYDAAMKASRMTMEDFRQIGVWLLEVKKKMEHGYWESWVAGNLAFSARQARRYIQLAKTDVTTDLEQEWKVISGNFDTADEKPDAAITGGDEKTESAPDGSAGKQKNGKAKAISKLRNEPTSTPTDLNADERQPIYLDFAPGRIEKVNDNIEYARAELNLSKPGDAVDQIVQEWVDARRNAVSIQRAA